MIECGGTAQLRAGSTYFIEGIELKDNKPSNTALGASVIRTVHQLMDDRPLILEDPISPLLLSTDALEDIKRNPALYQTRQARGLRSHIVLRSRYAEDELHHAVESGITQLINLGAGFDTFSCRQPDWARRLQILEVDHPASQEAKVKHFHRQGLTFSENVEFLPLDLEKKELSEALNLSTLNLKKPVFVFCLGVLAYLRQDTVERTFRSISNMSHGTMFVVAFAPRGFADGNEEASETAQRAESHGEPWLTYFERDELESLFLRSGFTKVDFLSSTKAAEVYYRGRKDLPSPRKTRLCTGVV
jgi:methyltransferase (TIGR00027 family)